MKNQFSGENVLRKADVEWSENIGSKSAEGEKVRLKDETLLELFK